MRQPDHEYEERSFGDIQRAIDFENSMNDLESQLYYQHLSPKEVAQQVLKATCQFYDEEQEEGVSGHKVRAEARDKLQIIKEYARKGKFDISTSRKPKSFG